MALVADVDDAVALAGAHLDLVMDLGDERAHRVDDVAAALAGRGDDLGRRPVGRQHDRRARRDVGDVVDEHHALALEALDDQAVVDDLVVAVDGRLERADHPHQRLDGHLDAGAEPSRLGQEHLFDCHWRQATDADPPVAWIGHDRIAFPGHAGRCQPLPRWRSVARIDEMIRL